MPNEVTIWYIEPLDSHTNKFLVGLLSPEDTCPDKMCSDGQKHDLWSCSRLKVQEVDDSKADEGLRYKVWVQEGQHNLPKPRKSNEKIVANTPRAGAGKTTLRVYYELVHHAD